MRKADYFLNYTDEDLRYELEMLVCCKLAISTYADPFLHCLSLEGWLLHTRRIIEAFHLDELDKKWEKRWGLISEHLSHPNPSNRKDRRTEKRENPRWDVEIWHHELIDALETVAEQHKSEYSHHALLVDLLKAAKSKPIAGEVLTTRGISAEESTDSKGS